MQNFNLIAQSVLKLSHRENADNDNDDDNDDDDTHPGWIIVHDGNYSVADKNSMSLDGNIAKNSKKGQKTLKKNLKNQEPFVKILVPRFFLLILRHFNLN